MNASPAWSDLNDQVLADKLPAGVPLRNVIGLAPLAPLWKCVERKYRTGLRKY